MFKTSDFLKKRVYAFTTDMFIITISNYFIVASFTDFLKTVFFHFPLQTQLMLISKLATMTSVSLMAITFAYFSIFYYVTNGQTMGKTLFGLKVVSESGELSLVQSMQRAFAYFACAMTGSFLFALSFIRKDHKSLADVISKTTVIIDPHQSIENLNLGTEFQLSLVDSINEIENEHVIVKEDKQAA